tara:strand:- start:739 stop:942 length:204 start_codon:yes stop_codon:yes gene_type:complete
MRGTGERAIQTWLLAAVVQSNEIDKKKPPPKAGVSKTLERVLPCFHPASVFSSQIKFSGQAMICNQL